MYCGHLKTQRLRVFQKAILTFAQHAPDVTFTTNWRRQVGISEARYDPLAFRREKHANCVKKDSQAQLERSLA
jgi:hypothetical protein